MSLDMMLPPVEKKQIPMKQPIFIVLILFLLKFKAKAEKIYIIGMIPNFTSLDKVVISSEHYEEMKIKYKISSLPNYAFIETDGSTKNKSYRPSEILKMFDKDE